MLTATGTTEQKGTNINRRTKNNTVISPPGLARETETNLLAEPDTA